MNQLIIFENEMLSQNLALISGVRVDHLNKILGIQIGGKIKVGLFGGKKGTAEIEKIDDREAILKINISDDPEPKIPLTVIVGLCRPKVLSRLIADLTSMGVSKIEIIQTFFGDKGYWENDLFTDEGITTAVVKGLEQSMDTVAPQISLIKRFGPYSNDILPGLISQNNKGFLAMPGSTNEMRSSLKGTENVVAIGPERGFTKYESEQFIKAGFIPVSLGKRIIRTETAVNVAVASFLY